MPTVLITRPQADAPDFANALARYGLGYEHFPTIDVAPIATWETPALNGYDGLIFASANAARCFLSELLAREPKRFARLRAMNHYAVGAKTNRALREYGIDSALYSDKGNAEHLVELLARIGVSGKRFLFLRGTRSLGVIPESIQRRGGTCDELTVYETRDIDGSRAQRLPELLARDDLAWIAFFSPSAAQSFFKLLNFAPLPSKTRIAAIGETTRRAVEELGYAVDLVAETPTAEALAQAIATATSR